MTYYQNKTTGAIIGVQNMREVIDAPTEQQTKIGYIGYSYHVVYDMICPNKLIPNGPISFCITHTYLSSSYKRINKKIALAKYPEFKQYLYKDLQNEANETGVPTLTIIRNQTF